MGKQARISPGIFLLKLRRERSGLARQLLAGCNPLFSCELKQWSGKKAFAVFLPCHTAPAWKKGGIPSGACVFSKICAAPRRLLCSSSSGRLRPPWETDNILITESPSSPGDVGAVPAA